MCRACDAGRGYLGVKSANNTAVAIARKERAARRRSELDSQKRIAYSSFLTALSQLADDQIKLDIAARQKRTEKDDLWLRAANSARIANDSLPILASSPLMRTVRLALKALRISDQANRSRDIQRET